MKLESTGTTAVSIGIIYAFAGCDFLPGIYGLSQDIYLKSFPSQSGNVGPFSSTSGLMQYELIVCLVYLYKRGISSIMTEVENIEHRRGVLDMVENKSLSRKDRVA